MWEVSGGGERVLEPCLKFTICETLYNYPEK